MKNVLLSSLLEHQEGLKRPIPLGGEAARTHRGSLRKQVSWHSPTGQKPPSHEEGEEDPPPPAGHPRARAYVRHHHLGITPIP